MRKEDPTTPSVDDKTRDAAQPQTRWSIVAESNAIDARAKLEECLAALDMGDLKFAVELGQSAAAKLSTAAAFDYVDRFERRRDRPPVLPVTVDDPVSKLRLSVALLNCLCNASIETVGELTAKSERDLWRCRGVGRKSIAAIRGRLSLAGLSLAEGDPS